LPPRHRRPGDGQQQRQQEEDRQRRRAEHLRSRVTPGRSLSRVDYGDVDSNIIIKSVVESFRCAARVSASPPLHPLASVAASALSSPIASVAWPLGARRAQRPLILAFTIADRLHARTQQ